MTHKDIYTKFMIEYDKANVTSSYPSLTEYEVATVLDKAYHALIAQKVTGNNIRRSTFESDTKAIADLGPLTKTNSERLTFDRSVATNVAQCDVPEDMLYFLQGAMKDSGHSISTYARFKEGPDSQDVWNPMDNVSNNRRLPVKLVNHEIAQKFFASSYNIPWIKIPVCYIEDKSVKVVYDPLSMPNVSDKRGAGFIFRGVQDSDENDFDTSFESTDNDDVYIDYINVPMQYGEYIFEDNKPYSVSELSQFFPGLNLNKLLQLMKGNDGDKVGICYYDTNDQVTPVEHIPLKYFVFEYVPEQTDVITDNYSFDIVYIRKPNTFVKDLEHFNCPEGSIITYFDYTESLANNRIYTKEVASKTYKERYEFECNDTVAEELISLAIIFALENVESQRLNSKLNTRGLEA